MAEAQAPASVQTGDPPSAKVEDPPLGKDPTKEVEGAMTDEASPKRPSADSGVTNRVAAPSGPATTAAAAAAPVEGAGASKTASTPSKRPGFIAKVKSVFSPVTKYFKMPSPDIEEPVTESTSEGTSLEPASPLVQLSDDEQAGPSTAFELPEVQPASSSTVQPAPGSSVQPAQEAKKPAQKVKKPAKAAVPPPAQQSPEKMGLLAKLRESVRFKPRRQSRDQPVAASAAASPAEVVVPVKLSKQDRIKMLQEATVFKESVDSLDSKSTESEMLTSAPITPDPFSPTPEKKLDEENQATEASSDPPVEASKEAGATRDPAVEPSKEAEVSSDPPAEVPQDAEATSDPSAEVPKAETSSDFSAEVPKEAEATSDPPVEASKEA